MCLTDRAGAILRHHTHSSQVKDTTVTAHWSAIGNGGGGEGEGEARDTCVRRGTGARARGGGTIIDYETTIT